MTAVFLSLILERKVRAPVNFGTLYYINVINFAHLHVNLFRRSIHHLGRLKCSFSKKELWTLLKVGQMALLKSCKRSHCSHGT